MFFTRLTAFFMAICTWFSVVFCPQTTEGVFADKAGETVQSEFDEGEFVAGKFDIIVAPDGDDSDKGTIDEPLKTPEAAKEKAKSLKGIADGTVTIWFREGTYCIENPLEFTSDDLNDVVYRSYPGEKVSFSGAKAINGFTDTKINGVDAFVTDVPINGDEDYFRSLFKDGKRLSRPNYPKEGVFTVADPKEDEAILGEWSPDFFMHSLVFYAHTDEILDFENPRDVNVRIMHFWCDDILPIHSVDTATGRIETTKPSSMRIRKDDNYVFENVKEALLLPGEWYLDREEEKLYYIPQSGETAENTVLWAGCTEQLMTVKGAENIRFQGINFENTDWNHVDGNTWGEIFEPSHPLYKNMEYGAVHPQAAFETPAAILISASSGIDFTDCRFENISYTAIKFEKASKNCNVTSCLFNEIGANAVFIHGEFEVPASTDNVNVTDCHISRYGRIFNNAIGILLTHAINCDLTNNEIHEGWYTGISVGWNWGYTPNSTNNINISNNLIYDIGNGWLSDMGAIYTLGIQPDTVISGNVIYNVGCDEGRYGYGGWGIYLDEGSSGMLVENNLVYDCSSETFHQHYGRDNVVRNNIFAFGGEGAFIITKNEEHNSLTLSNNILVVDNAPVYAFDVESDWFVDESNVYWDYTKGGNVYSGHSMKLFDRKTFVPIMAMGYFNNAAFCDPLFKDAENRDFTLAENSPALAAGFVPFAYDAGTLTKFN